MNRNNETPLKEEEVFECNRCETRRRVNIQGYPYPVNKNNKCIYCGFEDWTIYKDVEMEQ